MFISAREHINASATWTASSTKDGLRVVKQSRRAVAIECRHSYNKSRDSGISCLSRTLARKEAPNDFGEDADQFLTRRRDSIGAELDTKRQLSRSPPLSCSELAAVSRVPSPYKLQPNFNERLQTYYPLHQGPSITVSSADGTTLCAESESDSQRNAAAQSLFRALKRQHTEERLKTLDGHWDKIFGAVELDLAIRDMISLKSVDISENVWETESSYGMFESDNDKKIRSRAKRMRDMWNGWVAKIFG